MEGNVVKMMEREKQEMKMVLQRVDDSESHEMRWKCSKIKKCHWVI